MPDNSPDDRVYVRGASTAGTWKRHCFSLLSYFDFFAAGAAAGGFALFWTGAPFTVAGAGGRLILSYLPCSLWFLSKPA